MENRKGAKPDVAKKKRILDGGRIQLDFTGSINLNALGTTIVILGATVLLGLIASGLLFGRV